MTDRREKWYSSMRTKLGVSTDDEVREFMRQSSNKSRRNQAGTGGFAKLARENPELHKEISIKGGRGKKNG